MICQQCKQEPATVHMIHLNNGETTERHLCESCARKEGLKLGEDLLSNFSVNLLSGLIAMQFGGEQEAHSPGDQGVVSCPVCGLSYQQFQRTGRLGCDSCYQAFRQHLEPLLRRVHGSTMHRGKIPLRSGKTLEIHRQIAHLREELQRAINEERYEVAARLRDEVRVLESTVKS
ncbi:MAG: UvrB/UvrC motif-containing protein [Symbiobacteriaceae bacterium]|nr:UvrB/UvrC motif-containing protein [Symbiobacteriaceae bacterium]